MLPKLTWPVPPAVLLTAAACVRAPEYHRAPVPLPATWETPGPAVPAAGPSVAASAELRRRETGEDPVRLRTDFWRRLGDSTLTRLIDAALAANLDVRAAQARVSESRAQRAQSVLALTTPDASVRGGYSRQRFATASFPGALGSFPGQDVWDAGVDASWELDLFGRLRQTVRARSALVESNEESLRTALVSLSAELARTYFELRGAQERLEVSRRNADNQRRTLELTRERLEAGRGTAFDTERAAAQLSVTLAAIPSREAEVAAARNRIAVLSGQAPTGSGLGADTEVGLPDLPDSIVVEGPAVVIRARPDVAAAERYAAAQSSLAASARAEYLPRLTFGASAGYLAGDFSAIGNTGTLRYAVGPVLSWPAFNLGRIRQSANAAQARADAAEAEYGQLVLRAMEEVQSAQVRYSAARARLDQLEQAAAASGRAAALARMRFAEGITDFLQVLDAERTQLESEELLAQGRTEAATAYAAVFQAVGGR